MQKDFPGRSPNRCWQWSQRLSEPSDQQERTMGQRAVGFSDLGAAVSFAECVSGGDSIGASYSPEKPVVTPGTTTFFISVRNPS